MIVELCGIPGAGKSFLARALEADLHRAGQTTSMPLEAVSPRRRASARIPEKVLRASIEVLGHPVVSVAVIRAIASSVQQTPGAVMRRALNLFVLRGILRRARNKPGIHLIDQGLIQELGSLVYGARRSSAAAGGRSATEGPYPLNLLAAMDVADPGGDRLAPDVILAVEVEAGLADRRLEARPGSESRIERLEAGRCQQLERQAMLLSELLDQWVERFGHLVPTAVLRIENGEDGPSPDVANLVSMVTGRSGAGEAVA